MHKEICKYFFEGENTRLIQKELRKLHHLDLKVPETYKDWKISTEATEEEKIPSSSEKQSKLLR